MPQKIYLKDSTVYAAGSLKGLSIFKINSNIVDFETSINIEPDKLIDEVPKIFNLFLLAL